MDNQILEKLSEIVTELRITVATLKETVANQHTDPCIHLVNLEEKLNMHLKSVEKLRYLLYGGLVSFGIGVGLWLLTGCR